ncbi:MAG: CDP-alcohol phosphatidyltransferase family protein [Candidatus Gracilibacteria bacterium]
MTTPYFLTIIFIVVVCVIIYVLIDRRVDFRKCRLFKDRILLPITKFISGLGLSSAFFSVTSLTFGIFAAISYYFSFKYFLIFISIGTLCDIFDGSVARFTHTDSQVGRFMDYTFDRTVMLCVSIAVLLSIKDPAWYYIALPIYKFVPNTIFLLNRNKFKFLPLVPTMYLYYILLIFDTEIATVGALIVLVLNTAQIIYRALKFRREE